MLKQILIVDDEQNVLDGLQRMLRPYRDEWEVHFAISGAQALAYMGENPVDVIVADMRMPGMDGAELLAEVMKRHPNTVRVVLSGHADSELLVRSVGVTHQFLSKPCEPQAFRSTILRATNLRALLEDSRLKKVVSQMGSMPSPPMHYQAILKEIRSPFASIQNVGQMISKDPAMTAKVLQLVNSAFFGHSRAISNPTEAASYLGLVRIQQLCLTVYAFRQFEPQNCPYFSIERLWTHSVATAVLGKRLAESSPETRKFADDVYTAGLLHDIGKLVLVSRIPEEYANALNWAREHEVPGWQAEQELLHATHAEVGAYLLGLWGLPDAIVEAVAYHHRPGAHQGDSLCPLTLVHVADILEHERGTSVGLDVPPRLDMGYLTQINLQEQVMEWREEVDSTAEDESS